MKEYKLLSEYKLGNAILQNRVVMSPMTRSRSIGNIPSDLVADYYGQRSDAGLIITEGTSPSPNGLGYSRIPGIFSNAQIEGWKKVTAAVHKGGAKIFLQVMHTGRIGHPYNLPEGARIIAPSALKAPGHMRTDQAGDQEFPVPEEMSQRDIQEAKQEYVSGAVNAIEAGFDGIELHSANGYLPEQFISPVTNIRTDGYGGSIENRCRFVLEVSEDVSSAIGTDRTGIRLSPYGVGGGMQYYPEIDAAYSYLAGQLFKLNIAYIHTVDHSWIGAPPLSDGIKNIIRKLFKNTLILSGGYSLERAETDLQNNRGDLIAFGRPFISNPDLVRRFRKNLPLAPNPDPTYFYTQSEKGYTDYPTWSEKPQETKTTG
jgi:N-ethylmaleimide reductase